MFPSVLPLLVTGGIGTDGVPTPEPFGRSEVVVFPVGPVSGNGWRLGKSSLPSGTDETRRRDGSSPPSRVQSGIGKEVPRR